MKCNVCRDQKTVRLVTYSDVEVTAVNDFEPPSQTDPGFKEFPCPQCVPQVPYRRVRAMKIVTAYDPVEFGKYQMPIERSLAARFGEFLLREGLIRFTQKGSADLGSPADKITVTAHLGVVSREDVIKSGAVPEVATSAPPPLPQSVRERMPRAKRWQPKPAPWPDEVVTDEFDEPKDALGARFSGLEIG